MNSKKSNKKKNIRSKAQDWMFNNGLRIDRLDFEYFIKEYYILKYLYSDKNDDDLFKLVIENVDFNSDYYKVKIDNEYNGLIHKLFLDEMNNRNKEQKRFEEEINNAIFEKGLNKISYSDILVSKSTPKILQKVGLNDLPILFSKSHLYNALKPYNKKKHRKGLDLYKHIYTIPKMLEEPALILKDIQLEKETQKIKLDGKHSGDILLVSNIPVFVKEENLTYPIVISIKANSEKSIYLDLKEFNYLITIFGHDNIVNTVEEAVINNYILFYDKQKIQEIDQFTGKSLSNALSSLEPNKILQHINDNVKGKEDEYNEFVKGVYAKAVSESENATQEKSDFEEAKEKVKKAIIIDPKKEWEKISRENGNDGR